MLKIHQPDTFLDVEDTDHHLYIVNFAKLLEINIQIPLISDLKKYNCDYKLDKNARAFFYHHITHGMCQYILNISQNKNHKIVIYNNIGDIHKLNAFFNFEEQDVKLLISKILKGIGKNLPIRIYESSQSFYYFLGCHSGKKQEILAPIRQAATQTFESYTFNKAIKFANKHNLSFLSNGYFRQLKTKQLMFS